MTRLDVPEHAPAWWSRAVVYQIYPKSFKDSDGDGLGDLGGIREKLDYLCELGVDVLWLSPVYPSPQHDNGYDISDYQGIDPRFGTLAEFDALLDEVHGRGMRLVMDLVVNHTSDEHPWFVESRSSPDNPKRDWYWWREPNEGAEPNGWQASFGGPAWTLDPRTGQYYLHLFTAHQPDLNWENPGVRRAVYDMMRWWLDRGIDGFRMDVINFIAKPKELIARAESGNGFRMGPQIHDYLQEMHREVFEGRDGALLTVGEMPGATVEDAVLFTDPARREVDMIFQFEHVVLDHAPGERFITWPVPLPDLKRSLARWQEALADTGWNSLYLGNHDQPRCVSRFGDDGAYRRESATLLATVLHMHRGTPYVYQGDELGMTNAPFASIDAYRDVESVNYYSDRTGRGADPDDVLAAIRATSRDNGRTPVQWDGSPQAGFTTGVPWIAVNPNHRHVNAETDRSSSRSVFRHYQRLISLRHELDVVALGDFSLLEPDHPRLWAFTRSLGEDRLLVVANLSGEELGTELTAGVDDGDLVIGNWPDPLTRSLRPWEARVYRSVGRGNPRETRRS